MKKLGRLMLPLLLCLCLLTPAAQAGGGLLPGTGELLGEYMPRAAYALGREPAQTAKENGAQREIYASFTAAEWEALGAYLSGWGCKADEGIRDGETLTVAVTKEKLSITLLYDRSAGTLTVEYPKGTRPEAEKKEGAKGKDILPSLRQTFGAEMPDFAKSFGKQPSSDSTDASGVITRVFTGAEEEDYTAFSVYAAAFGCALGSYTYENGAVTCRLIRDGAAITFAYDRAKKEAVLTYPADTWVTAKAYSKKAGTGILPSPEALYGVYLPSFAEALQRLPESETVLSDNTVCQRFDPFTDGDYNTVSAFIASSGCAVTGYTVEGAVMNIQLEKNGLGFTFVYDRANASAEVLYPQGTRPDKVVLATATPKPTPTKAPTAKPTATAAARNYTPNQCYDIAVKRLRNSLKNPSSLIVNGNTYYESNGCYVFTLDYSAQNGFGGYNRANYYVSVDYTTGIVQYAFSSE